MHRARFIAPLLALAGCTASYTAPSLTADHPASVSAEQAPPATRRPTLDLPVVDVVETPAGPATEHAGHEASEKNVPQQPEAAEDGAESPAAARPGDATALYSCPMHPEVTSDKLDQRCPKCGMRLKGQNGGTKP